VLHKGLIEELPASFVVESWDALKPVFANEVFIILARGITSGELPGDNPHIAALTERLPSLAFDAEKEPPQVVVEPVLPEPGAIFKFSVLEPEEFADAMDEFWLQGGYIYSTRRDQSYYAEIDRYIAEFVGERSGLILDLACGIGRCGALLSSECRITGIDVSRIAIEMAQERHHDKPNFKFEVMDAHSLSFPDQHFDVVLFVDAIEHVMNVERVFAEISRVLKSDGALMLTVANRNSVNQILTRKLGYPEFVTNYQHIREFSYPETLDLLRRHGFRLEREAGIFLYPYWGVPGVDEIVRKVTDHDPEFVDLMRDLGERIGAEHAYCSVVLGRKKT
jgi:SAM-dependent methyltransferase